MMNREKIIKKTKDDIITGYLGNESEYFIYHSFDDEPARIFTNCGTKMWYKDGLRHRDNNLPAVIYSGGSNSFYKNDKRYWFINNKEYYYMNTIKKKFKNNILTLKYIPHEVLKENGIVDALWLTWYEYLILDQSQYNLAVLKFI